MKRTALGGFAVLLACGCANSPAANVAAGPHEAYPDKAFNLQCGTQALQIHFTDMEAHLSNPAGAITLLKRLEGGPAVYTDGRVTFTRSGDGSKISFARGKMIAVPCTGS